MLILSREKDGWSLWKEWRPGFSFRVADGDAVSVFRYARRLAREHGLKVTIRQAG